MSNNLTLTGASFDTSGQRFGLASLSGGSGQASTNPLPISGTTDVRVQAWGKMTGSSPFAILLGCGDEFFFGYLGSNTIQLTWGGLGSTVDTGVSNLDGDWHAYRLELGSGGGKFFIDGVLVYENSAPYVNSSSGPFKIGDYGSGFPWTGEIDDVGVFRTLIGTNYTPAQIDPTDSSLVALWAFDGNGSDTAGTTSISPSVLSVGPLDTSSIQLSWTSPSGGTGTLATHLWRGEGRFNDLTTDLGVVWGTSFADSTVQTNRVYDYALVTTDSASVTGTSNRVTSFLGDQGILKLGVCGDSNYGSGVTGRTTDTAIETASALGACLGLRSVVLTNQSAGGKGMYNFVQGTTLFNNMVAAFNTANVEVAFLIHGYNDTNNVSTKDQYKADCLNVINGLYANVPSLQKIVLGYCFCLGHDGSSDDRNQLILTYHEGQDEIVNGTTILQGSKMPYRFLSLNPALQTIDNNVHLNDAGCRAIGRLHAEGIAKALYFPATFRGPAIYGG